MPRDTRLRRRGRQAGGATAAASNGSTTARRPLISLLAHSRRIIDVLPDLHQHALDVTGGTCLLLFEYNPRNGTLQATSGFGLDSLRTDVWFATDAEEAVIDEAFARGAPTLVTDPTRQTPDLAARLGARSVLLFPLAQSGDRVGLVAVGFADPPRAGALQRDVHEIGDAYLAALELFRLRQAAEVQRDVGELLDDFTLSLSTTLNLGHGLDLFCLGVSRLFGADRTSVWLHDRRARQLVLQASSDPEHVARGVRVDADDPLAPAAVTMRRSRSEIEPPADEQATSTVTVPLRAYRRALGTIVFEGVRVEAGGELALLDRADGLGRQLAGAIEAMQLLEDVVRSRRELQNTFDSIGDLVAVSDRSGRVVHVNKAFAARLGAARATFADRPLADCFGRELADWLSSLRPDGAAERTERSREITDPILNGTFVVTVTDLVDQDRHRIGSVLVARDLAPQTRLEAEREELRSRLTQSEKLAALGQVIAGIAHELNNPLQGVLGHLELMRATGAFPKQLRAEVQTIYREADRAAKIVRSLLVFAGSRRLSQRRMSLNSVLQKIVVMRTPACRAAGIELVRRFDDKLPRVHSDPLMLHQALLNIVMNAEQAIAATNRGGRIEIGTSRAASADGIVVTVRDTGPGIPPEALSRVFEPFYTTKEVGRGTGLGLAIAYGIVQDHGGRILAANDPSGGACFTVELPAAAGGRGND